MRYLKFLNEYNAERQSQAIGIPASSQNHNKVLAEAVIIEMLGSEENYKKFLEESASYIEASTSLQEHGIILESNEVVGVDSVDVPNSKIMSVLVTAKEADDPNFRLFENALGILIETITVMTSKYDRMAENRLQTINEAIKADPRLMKSINEAKK